MSNSSVRPSLLERLASELRADIAARRLPFGTRLPSVRMLARERGVSAFTAAAVYERLVAAGDVEARRGSGYFVASGVRHAAMQRGRGAPSDSLWENRADPQASGIRIDAGCGWLPNDWLPHESIRAGLRACGSSPGLALEYATPQGLPELRDLIALQLRGRGVEVDADQVLTTQGASQALDLIVRELLQPGDVAVLEDPTYPPLLEMLRARGTQFAWVSRTETGPNLDQLEQLLRKLSPKLLFTNTTLHNPTGTSTTAPVAHRLLELAERYDFRIIEDDIYAELAPPVPASLVTLDQCRRVVLVQSVSKTIAPDLRVGYAAAHPEIVRRLVRAKARSALASSALVERLVLHILTRGHYRRHLETLRRRLGDSQRRVQQAFEALGIDLFHRPSGGMFLWAKLALPMSSGKLWRLAAGQGVLLAPGEVFQCDGRASAFWRFNVAHADSPLLYDFLREIQGAKA